MTGYRLPSTPAAAIKQQTEIAKKVVDRDDFGSIELVCGVDVSYRRGVAHCEAVVMDRELNVVERAGTKSAVRHPYIPGLFMLREAGPILRTLKRIKKCDLLLVDGHGRLHPRRCGLACYIGVAVDRPAIGVAKSLLAGRVRDNGYVEIGGEVLGCAVDGLYVSVGHRVSLETAVDIVRKFTTAGQRLPEPLRLADVYSKIRS